MIRSNKPIILLQLDVWINNSAFYGCESVKVDHKLDRKGRIHQSYCSCSPANCQKSLFRSSVHIILCASLEFWLLPQQSLLITATISMQFREITILSKMLIVRIRLSSPICDRRPFCDRRLRFCHCKCLRSQIGFFGMDWSESYCSHSHRHRKGIGRRHLSKSSLAEIDDMDHQHHDHDHDHHHDNHHDHHHDNHHDHHHNNHHDHHDHDHDHHGWVAG